MTQGTTFLNSGKLVDSDLYLCRFGIILHICNVVSVTTKTLWHKTTLSPCRFLGSLRMTTVVIVEMHVCCPNSNYANFDLSELNFKGNQLLIDEFWFSRHLTQVS